ncbi:MAG: hypothetical protein ACI4KM_09135 [Oscillospiraceae bacterium]
MSEKFWSDSLSQIDEKFTDEAAEHIIAATDADSPETSGAAVAELPEIKSEKRLRKGVFAGILAAAAAVGIITTIMLNRNTGELTESSSGVSAIDLSKPESSSYAVESDSGAFPESVLDPDNYSMDIAMFKTCFEYIWQETENSGNEYKLSLLEDDFFNLFGRRMIGLRADDKGWYILCDYYGGSDFGNDLLFIPRSDPETMYHYSDAENAVVNQPNCRYKANYKLTSVSLENPTRLGTAGLQFFCEKYGADIERFTDITAEFDGQTYTTNADLQHSGNITVTYITEDIIKFTEVLYPAENPTPESAMLFEITLTKNADNAWVQYSAECLGLRDKYTLPEEKTLYYSGFDFDVLERSFFGVWYNEFFDWRIQFSYSEDCFNVGNFYPLSVFSDAAGSYISGINGGMGFAFFVPESNPNVMYYYTDLGEGETLIDEPVQIFRKTSSCVVWNKYPAKLSVLGMRYLESGRAGEVIKLELPETITDSSGEQWVYQNAFLSDEVAYNPYYLIDRNGGGKTDNILLAAKYYLLYELDELGGHTPETTARYFTLEFDYTTKEFICSYDWGDSIQDFDKETEFSKQVIENARADFADDYYCDSWRTATVIDSWYRIGFDGTCFALRNLREAYHGDKIYTELFYNANNGTGFRLVYSTNDIVTLKYMLEDYGYAYLYSSDFEGGANIIRVSSAGEVETAYIPKEQFGEMNWQGQYLLCTENDSVKFALNLLTMQPAEDYPEEYDTSDTTGGFIPDETEWLFIGGAKWASAATIPDLKWVYELGITEADLGEIAGEVRVKVPKNTDGIEDGSATGLQAGTPLYSVKSRGDILAFYNERNELEFYYKWVEG